MSARPLELDNHPLVHSRGLVTGDLKLSSPTLDQGEILARFVGLAVFAFRGFQLLGLPQIHVPLRRREETLADPLQLRETSLVPTQPRVDNHPPGDVMRRALPLVLTGQLVGASVSDPETGLGRDARRLEVPDSDLG